LGAKIRLGVPKSRPVSVLGRGNTPGNAEIAPGQFTTRRLAERFADQ
jgi:hypothetical protein